MENIRLCLVGAGRAGMVHANNIVSNIKNAQLTAVVDEDEEVAQQRAQELGVKQVFTDIHDALAHDLFDAVVIVTPTFTHKGLVLTCAEAGKHIFCEKPMAVKENDAKEMLESATAHRVKLQIGFMRHFDPPFVHAKEIIDKGTLGEVMIIKSLGRGPGLPPPWAYSTEKSNGMFGEVNSHDFDSTRWLAGSEYTRIYAEAVNRKVDFLKKDHPDFYDNAVCTLRFLNEVIGTIDGTCPVEYGYDARTEIVLTKGLIRIGEVNDEALVSCDAEGIIKARAFKSWRNRFREAYLEEMRHFIDCLIEDKDPEVSGKDGLATVQAVVAANKSIRTGQPVEL